MPRIQVTVRDGRVGRDPQLVTDEGGEVLHEFEVDEPYGEEHIGMTVALPDAGAWPIIGFRENFGPDAWHQTLFIGDA